MVTGQSLYFIIKYFSTVLKNLQSNVNLLLIVDVVDHILNNHGDERCSKLIKSVFIGASTPKRGEKLQTLTCLAIRR